MLVFSCTIPVTEKALHKMQPPWLHSTPLAAETTWKCGMSASRDTHHNKAAFCHLWMIKKLKASDTKKNIFLTKRFMGGENWKKLSQNSESLNLGTQDAWNLSQGGHPGTLGPTNITNLHLHNFHFTHVILLRMNRKIGKHGRYVLWSHTYGIMLRELNGLKQCLFCILCNDYKN